MTAECTCINIMHNNTNETKPACGTYPSCLFRGRLRVMDAWLDQTNSQYCGTPHINLHQLCRIHRQQWSKGHCMQPSASIIYSYGTVCSNSSWFTIWDSLTPCNKHESLVPETVKRIEYCIRTYMYILM